MVLTRGVLHAIHVVDNLRESSGGPSRSVTAVADALAHQDVLVSLISSETSRETPIVRPGHPEVTLTMLDADPRAAFWRGVSAPFGQATERSAQRAGETVVHTHGLWVPSNRAAALAAHRIGAPLVVSPKGMLSRRALRVKRLKKRVGWHLYQRRVLQMATAFQATSDAEAEDIRRLGFRQPVAVIPHGVALSPAAPRPETREGRTALFLSRFHPIKGLPDLIEAWDRVRPSGWRLLLVGPDEGGHRAEIEQLVAARRLSDVVSFAPPVAGREKQNLLASADLFVLPSHSENFGLVVAEALASGVPVLTTRGTPWQALETHQCGWWTDTGSSALADALQDATASAAETLQAMGERGRVYVDTHLSWSRSGASHAALYRWLLGTDTRPACIVDT